MKLLDLYNQYSSGKLKKQRYINIMHKKHQILFDYFDYIKKTDIQSIVIDNNSIYITVKGSNIKLLLDRFDKRFIPIEMLNFHSIEPREIKILLKIASGCRTIFNIGANIGWYSLNFAKLPKVKRIYAFEPIPYAYNYLKKHLQINNIRKVSAFNFAFSDTAGEKIFYWTKEETGSSSMRNIRKRRKINKIKCKVKTLDKFMKNRHHGLDLIKCDVEGAELFVIKGGLKTIRKTLPILFLEMLRKWSAKYNYHPNDIIKIFNQIGYSCYYAKNNKLVKIKEIDEKTIATNFYFLHAEKHSNLLNGLI